MNTKKAYILASFLAISILVVPSFVFAQGAKAEANRAKAGQAETASPKKMEGQNNADSHRSAVSTFVQNLLKVADKVGNGIGDEVRVVAQEQYNSTETVSAAIEAVENRNSVKTFLIGTDYKNIGMIRSEMVKTQARIEQLTRTMEKMKSPSDTASTTVQIQNLTQEQTRLNNFIQQNENKFSLFGWFVKLFNK